MHKLRKGFAFWRQEKINMKVTTKLGKMSFSFQLKIVIPQHQHNENFCMRKVLVDFRILVVFFAFWRFIQVIFIKIGRKIYILKIMFAPPQLDNKQVCIQVGCLPPACCPCLPACTGPGRVSAFGGDVCL